MSACGPPKCRLCNREHWQRDGCSGRGYGDPVFSRQEVREIAKAIRPKAKDRTKPPARKRAKKRKTKRRPKT